MAAAVWEILHQHHHHKEILVVQLLELLIFLQAPVEAAQVLVAAADQVHHQAMEEPEVMDCQHFKEILEFQLLMEHLDQHLEDGLRAEEGEEKLVLLSVLLVQEVLAVAETVGLVELELLVL
jgi:hypothetical protein